MTISPVSTYTTQVRHQPYITNQQYKKAPTGVPWQSLVSGGNARDQESQLTQLIERASTWVDSICMQVLCSTQDTEQGIVTTDQYGRFRIHPRYQPITELVDFWYGPAPTQLTEVQDLSGCWIEPKRMIIQPSGAILGPAVIQLGPPQGLPGTMSFARWTYINGYPVTALTVAVEAGATSIEIDNPIGIMPNFTPLRIEDAQSENVTVDSVSGNTVNLSSPLQYSHTATTAVTALPKDVEEAVILAVGGLAKIRGSGATQTASTSALPASYVAKEQDPLGSGFDLSRAEQILIRGDYLREIS